MENCQNCGGEMKVSKRGKSYCANICWEKDDTKKEVPFSNNEFSPPKSNDKVQNLILKQVALKAAASFNSKNSEASADTVIFDAEVFYKYLLQE